MTTSTLIPTHWLLFDGDGELLLRPLGLLFALTFFGLRLFENFAERGGEARFFTGLGEDE